jgi:hypothetical protein
MNPLFIGCFRKEIAEGEGFVHLNWKENALLNLEQDVE